MGFLSKGSTDENREETKEQGRQNIEDSDKINEKPNHPTDTIVTTISKSHLDH